MERYLGESDWDDIDLITTEEAAFRFTEEIDGLRSLLRDESAGDPGALAAARARLDLLIEAQQRLSTPRRFQLPSA